MLNKYYLFLVLPTKTSENFLDNKHFIMEGTLQELDNFTINYQDAQDLGDEINTTNNKVLFSSAIIISEYTYKKLKQNNWEYFNNIKIEQPLFLDDLEFYQYQTLEDDSTTTYNHNLIKQYKNFLSKNRQFIDDSLIKYTKVGIKINSFITSNNLEKVFHAYYYPLTYKKVRDTYLILKEKGMIEQSLTNKHKR